MEEKHKRTAIHSEIQKISVIRMIAVKEKSFPSPVKCIRTPEDAAKLVIPFLKNADREYLLVCCLDCAGHPISLEVAAIGKLDGCLTGIRELFKNAILNNAFGIVLFHNHPSGVLKPSREDIQISEEVREAGDLLGIVLFDHIILGDEGHFASVAEIKSWQVEEPSIYRIV